MLTLSPKTIDLWLWQFDGEKLTIRSPHAKSCEESAPAEDRAERLKSLLTPEEQHYATGLGKSALRLRWTEARAGLRRILAAYLDAQPGSQPEPLRLERAPHGKPYLAGQDGQPHALQFNLSHTPNWCAVVVAKQMAVGVDIEQPRAISARLWPRVLTPSEVTQMATLPAAEQTTAFLRSWTRKEALGKAEGQGLLPQLGRTETGLHRHDGLLAVTLGISATESETWFLRELPAKFSTNPPANPLINPPLIGAIAASAPFEIVERDYSQLWLE